MQINNWAPRDVSDLSTQFYRTAATNEVKKAAKTFDTTWFRKLQNEIHQDGAIKLNKIECAGGRIIRQSTSEQQGRENWAMK